MKDFQVKSTMVMKLLYELFTDRATYNLLSIDDVTDFYADIREAFDCGDLLESLNVNSPEDMRMMLIYYNDYKNSDRSEEDLLSRVFRLDIIERLEKTEEERERPIKMVKNNEKIKGVAVTFEHLIYLNSEDYDISSLDRETIKELALEKWNKEMSEEDKELTHDDIVEIEVEIDVNKRYTTFVELYDFLADLDD